ncbi:MAG: DUF1648 domain-containing protein [Salinivirgaceae bacterium]|nr:DUF1648 domain-containing protein [Salinivirgaceae bacterium]
MKNKTVLITNVATGLCLAATLILIIWKYPTLPTSIPTHFSLDGVPNGFSSRNIVFVFWGVSMFFYLLMLFVQKKPKLINLSHPTDKNGNPLMLTESQRQRFVLLNIVVVTLAISISVILLCYLTLAFSQIYTAKPIIAGLLVFADVCVIIVGCYKTAKFKCGEDDYIKQKLELSHSLFLEKVDNEILEQLRVLNGLEYLSESKRLRIINDVRSTHSEVVDYLRKAAPSISDDDITYCLLCNVGLNNNSISACMASSEEALRKRKSRIRKKLPESLAMCLFDDCKGI